VDIDALLGGSIYPAMQNSCSRRRPANAVVFTDCRDAAATEPFGGSA